MNIENKKILVVEDEFITSADLIANLEHMGFIVPASTDTGEEVYNLALQYAPDLILMDINLKGEMTGIVAAEIIKRQLDIPVVFLTGQSDEATIENAISCEPFGYIIKPFDDRSLKTAIAIALYKHSVDHQLKVSEERYRRIAESSDNLIAILNPDTTFDYINHAGSKLLMRNPGDIIGTSVTAILSSPMLTEMEQQIKILSGSPGKWTERMILMIEEQEIWVYATLLPLDDNLSGPCQVLWIAKDITDWIMLQQKMDREGIMQIEKNMEQFQILNDQIRNPLTLIASYSSMDDGPSCEKILNAVKNIDDLVTQLDMGWIESNKVRSFLLRHYRHGEEL